jgi:hypothetical protein
MSRFTDETLMAYADGALPAAEAAEVAAALESDGDAQALVAKFRRTADLSRAAFSGVVAEPVPDILVRTVLDSKAHTANVTALATARKPRSPRWRSALPLAASVLLVVGLAAALYIRTMPTTSPAQMISLGPVAPATQLSEVLEKHASGAPAALRGREGQGAEHLMIVATFRDRKARICREVEMLDENMQAQIAGVACRDSARGTWIVEGTARIAASPAASGSDFVPSGAEEKDALEGLLGVLGATNALPIEEEQRLIAQGWR